MCETYLNRDVLLAVQRVEPTDRLEHVTLAQYPSASYYLIFARTKSPTINFCMLYFTFIKFTIMGGQLDGLLPFLVALLQFYS